MRDVGFSNQTAFDGSGQAANPTTDLGVDASAKDRQGFSVQRSRGWLDIRGPRTNVLRRICVVDLRFEIGGLLDQNRRKLRVLRQACELEKCHRLTRPIPSSDHHAVPLQASAASASRPRSDIVPFRRHKNVPTVPSDQKCRSSLFRVQTVSNFSITSVSARPAFVHSWNAGKAIIVSM